MKSPPSWTEVQRPTRFAPLPLLVLGIVLAAAPACAGAPSSSSAGGSGTLTRDDLVDLTSRDAYEVVERLRPSWLRTRGRTSIRNPRAHHPVVYVDGIRYGDLASLRQISVDSVEEIRYLGASAATTRFGTGHAGGVIMVATGR